jgi:peptide/nickel transport system substrate-binding protein
LKKLRWQVLVVFLSLIGIGVLLLGQDKPLLSGIEGQKQPVAGGSYTEALIGAPARLNPLLDFYNQVDYDVDSLIYSRLINFDDRGLPHGDLAKDWGISQDGKRYSFSIRKNAFWHDGKPVTSDDVVFTIDLLKNDEMPTPEDIREFWKQVEVIALDDKTLQFTLPEPFSPFLDYLNIGILPKHLLEGLAPREIIASTFNLQPIGSGPFQFKTLELDAEVISGIELERFDGYYAAKPFLEQLNFRYYPNAQSALDALTNGEVQGVGGIPNEVLQKVLEDENLQLFASRLPRLAMIYLNLDNSKLPFFKEPEIRRALMQGLNRNWIINHLLKGQAVLANGPIFPENWAFYNTSGAVDYNPERALELLKEAGYTIPAEGGQARQKDGVSMKFELVHPDTALYTAIAERIQKDWARLGVVVSLKAVSNEELLQNYLEKRNYQAALVELDFSRSPDPDPYPFWHQGQIVSGQNYAQWDDRQVSEYLEQARVLDDLNERIRRYRNFQVRFAGELPALPLFYPIYSFAVDRSINGVSVGPLFDPSDRFANIASWFTRTAPQAQIFATATPNP